MSAGGNDSRSMMPSSPSRRPPLLHAVLVFVIGVIAPSLGARSFFRFDDFTWLVTITRYAPDVSVQSFLNLFQPLMWEYYRPVPVVFWWIGHLIGNQSALVYHGMTSLYMGLTAVGLYLIGRSCRGASTGLLAAVAFATFAPTVVASWWISNWVGILGGCLFVCGIVCFLSLPRASRVLTGLLVVCFTGALFSKNSFVFLSILPLAMLVMLPDLRHRARWFAAGLAILLAGASVVIASTLVDATVNRHVHLNPFDLDARTSLLNLLDYWGLLAFGHNIYFTVCSLLSHDVRVGRFRLSRQITLPLALLVVLILRITDASDSLRAFSAGLFVLFLINSSATDRLWALWMVLGLSQVAFWDLRILGGLMNRFVIEPSAGFALLVGSGLAAQLSDVRHLVRGKIKDEGRKMKDESKEPFRTFVVSNWSRLLHAGALCLMLILGLRSEVATSPWSRELKNAMAEGRMMEDTVAALVNTLPRHAPLYGELPLIAGIQHYSQLTDALIAFGRPDIQLICFEKGEWREVLPPPSTEVRYLLTGRRVDPHEFPGYAITEERIMTHGPHTACLYRFTRRESSTTPSL